MNVHDIADVLNKKQPGTFITILVERTPKLLTAHKKKAVRKVSKFQGMLCLYSRRAPVKNAVEKGTRLPPELPKGIKEAFYIGRTRFYFGENGEFYFPIPVEGNFPQVTWTLDGKEVSKSEIETYLQACEKTRLPDKAKLAEKGQAPFVYIKAENVREIR